jgi:DNA helicase-2/ATP-dependent DNA helicase PcrA
MEEFESLAAFLEHVSLVMEIAQDESGDRINLMTLHAAKGLEFDTVFLPGWEEGLFPSQRSMDENGLAGLEEERRLAYVGLTRAKKRAHISFAANRRVHGSWQAALPSRFLKEMPEAHVETTVDEGFYGGYSGFRDNAGEFGSTYDSPGWRRAQANMKAAQAGGGWRPRPPLIEAQAFSVQTSDPGASQYARGDRVFHQKFGYGRVRYVEGNKLTVEFDKAGEKRVIDQFVSRA